MCVWGCGCVCVCRAFFIGITKMLQLHYSTLSLKNIFSLFDSVDNGNLLYFSINRFFLHWPSELHANIFRSYVAYWHFNVQYIFCTCFFYLENVDFDFVVCVWKPRADNFPRCFACREADGETTRRRLMSVRHFIHQLCAVSGCFS